jgi:glycosyltransferase involved in cell wall biosynthesis
MRTAEYIKDLPIKKVLMAEDCRTLYQKRSYETTKNIKQKIVRWWEYKKLKKYEPEIVEHFDFTTLVTEEDISSMKKLNPNANYRLLTNGTDLNKFKTKDNTEKKGILFAGKLDIWANVLMLEDIVNNIFPKIKIEIPDALLNIVGANPTKAVLRLEREDVNIYPNVPDMVPYLQQAQLFLHPHVGGSGIQNKLLEAMACGCPVVTTPTGIQGIPATNGENILIGTSKEELIEQTIRLLKDSELADKLSKNGRDLIEKTRSWEKVFEDLDFLIDKLLNSDLTE